MLNLTNNTEPSLHIRDRASRMWATKYDQGQHTVIYRVVPFGAKHDHKSKDRRLVVFDVNRQTADCLSLETGEVCEANSYGRLCSHVYAASKRLRNQQTKKAA